MPVHNPWAISMKRKKRVPVSQKKTRIGTGGGPDWRFRCPLNSGVPITLGNLGAALGHASSCYGSPVHGLGVSMYRRRWPADLPPSLVDTFPTQPRASSGSFSPANSLLCSPLPCGCSLGHYGFRLSCFATQDYLFLGIPDLKIKVIHVDLCSVFLAVYLCASGHDP